MSDQTVVTSNPFPLRRSTRAAPARAAAPFDISVHFELHEVAEAWRQLETAGAAGVFQRYEVFEAWTRTVARGQASWFVVQVRMAPTQRTVMLMPLALRRAEGLRVIEGADLEVSDFLAPVVARDFRPSRADMRSIWTEVSRMLPAADLVRISKMPALVGDTPNPMLQLRGVELFHLSNFRTRLVADDVSWTDRIPAKVRADIAARRRKLGKRGAVRFHVAETEAEAERYFETMMAQRSERCRAMGRGNILESRSYREFYRSLLRPGAANSIGLMQALLVDDDVVATGYGLNAGTSFLMIFPSFASTTWRNYSPGMQLFFESMRWAEERGMTWYDFTIGGESFKRDLAAEATPLFEYLEARSLRGVPSVVAARVRAQLRQSRAVRRLVQRWRGLKG